MEFAMTALLGDASNLENASWDTIDRRLLQSHALRKMVERVGRLQLADS